MLTLKAMQELLSVLAEAPTVPKTGMKEK